jgi:hypothetical protein
MSYFEGRHPLANVKVITLEDKPKLLFSYECPVAKGDADRLQWSSTLFFLDVDGDGVQEICADRSVLERGRDTPVKEYEIYRYEPSSERFVSWKRTSSAEFNAYLAREQNAPRIEQQAGPVAVPMSGSAPRR